MSELKPCPFCGGRATVKTRYIGYGSIGLGEHDEYRVVCKECRASNDEYRHEAEAIAAWNLRADDERLKNALKEIIQLACESVEREKTLARIEAEVVARLEEHHEAD